MTDVIQDTAPAPVDLNDGSPPGHAEKMLNMVTPVEPEGAAPAEPEGTVTPRPDNVPEKFWDAEKGVINTEALLKSQADGEAALRGDEPKDEPKPEGEEPADESLAGQPKVVQDASAEYAEKGELSADTYKALEKSGLSNEMVNEYIAGQKAIIGSLQDAAYEPFSGSTGYEEAANWAAANMDEGEIKALDVQLTSTNPAIVAQGAKSLQKAYAEGADREPNMIRGTGNTSTAGDVYGSSREMMKDMNSAKYRTSQAFRDVVAAKLGRSSL